MLPHLIAVAIFVMAASLVVVIPVFVRTRRSARSHETQRAAGWQWLLAVALLVGAVANAVSIAGATVVVRATAAGIAAGLIVLAALVLLERRNEGAVVAGGVQDTEYGETR